MFNEFLFTEIEEEDISNIWFQQHSATCQTADVTLVVLRSVFEDRIISRRANVVWPPRSYDLTIFVKPLMKYSCTQSIMCWLLHGQLGQPFERKYFPLLTGRIVLSNKKRNLRNYSVYSIFQKKEVIWRNLYFIQCLLQCLQYVSFGHLGAAIFHCWTIICGVPICQTQLTL